MGSTTRSAKMKAITPANEIPPDHRTAASGTLPIEHTKLSTAISGPTSTFASSGSGAGAAETNSERAIAIAAYEHDDEAAPRAVARTIGPAPLPPSEAWMRARGTDACTTAEIAKPSTSAHQTS